MKSFRWMFIMLGLLILSGCGTITSDENPVSTEAVISDVVSTPADGILMPEEEYSLMLEQSVILQEELTVSNLRIDNLESELKSLEDELEQAKVKLAVDVVEDSSEPTVYEEDLIVEPIDEWISLDGSIHYVTGDHKLIWLDGVEYISFDLIREVYGYDSVLENPVKGYPFEGNYIVGEEAIVYINDLTDDLKEEFENSGDYKAISKEIEGLTIVYGEVGVSEYIITEPTYLTRRGITVGSTREDVSQAYGLLGEPDADYWQTFQNSAEYSEGSTYTFVFKEDLVTEIHYGWK